MKKHIRLVFGTAVAVLLFATLGCAAHKYHLVTAPAVPAAKGTVQVGSDDNGNTTIDLKVEDLAEPHRLTPPRGTYVVWIQPEAGQPKNEGELRVGSDLKGEFKDTTSYRNFEIFVTAENNARTGFPTGQRLLRQEVNR